ncbi:MAG: SirB2 family protein [Gallionella sp.]|nr:SirB2 family protein [Gallionella sp.]MDD4946009.1 SirB2 family protein [Gallionella sp.]
MSFMLLKTLHVGCVVVSFALFFLRGLWTLNDSPIMRQRWVRIMPHIVDTLLLTSAIALASIARQYPFVDAWLTAKVLALLLYIILGSLALKHARTPAQRLSLWLAAQAVFGYIVLVAINHNPLPL